MIDYKTRQYIYRNGEIQRGPGGGMIYLEAAKRLDAAGVSTFDVAVTPIEITPHGVVYAQIVKANGARIFRFNGEDIYTMRRRGKLLTNQGQVIR